MKGNSIKKARDRYNQEWREAFYNDVLAQLQEAIQLKENGKDAEGDAVVNNLKAELDRKIKEGEKRLKATEPSSRVMDRSVLPGYGEEFCENDKVLLRVICTEEREDYLAVSFEYSCMKSFFKDDSFKDELWNDFMNPKAFVCTIIDKQTGSYVGYCSIKNLQQEDWELSIELDSQWCHKGYGSTALSIFMKKLALLTKNRFFRARVDIDNVASQSLMKKLGAYPNGVSEFMLHGKNLEEFKKDNIDMINDRIREVAEEFCMEAEDILGLVLEYRFDMGNEIGM